ncbi:MAG: secondary thiamine-phosphate synthase enzyme YjbQ, partial [Cyclobacteriaceae bacterium]|nr:secondary thiamine-phosphate synthase enzyme YjbQ [Cyclobacteriaceae bacterium HetDA_MAG_MS6]
MVFQKEITLPAFKRGFHLITRDIEPIVYESGIQSGWCQVFIKHTSASLTVNENADPTVRQDFERFFNQNIPENAPYFKHIYEGPDDMPAHIQASILGCQVTIPITAGQLNLGTW